LSRRAQASILELFFVKVPSEAFFGVGEKVINETLKAMAKIVRKAKTVRRLNLDYSGFPI